MSMDIRKMVPVAFLLMALLTACGKSSVPPRPPVPSGAPVAVIHESASTNTPAVVVSIHGNGSAVWHVERWRTETHGHSFVVGHSAAASSLLHNLRVLGSVHSIKGSKGGCMKSTSFGTTITVTYRSETSTDLTCLATSATPRALKVSREAATLADRGIRSSV